MAGLRELPWDDFVKATGSEPREICVKNNGRRYACLDVPYWDPEKKKPMHRRKTIGYYDDSGNMILTGSADDTRPRTMPKKETYAQIYEIGRSLLFDGISSKIGLGETVEKVFGKDAEAIMTCAYYLAGHSDALCHCEQWSAGSETPFGGRLADQRISELLQRIDFDRRCRFFNEWKDILGDDDNYALDITSVSSYSELVEIVRAGYNRDKEDLEQINIALLIGSKSRMPAYFSILPGNINDKTSLKRFLHAVRAFGYKKFSLVTDKGFYTKDNIDEMYRLRQRFVTSIENRISIARDAIDGARGTIERFDNYYDDGASKVYCQSSSIAWACKDGSRHRCHVHVYFDPQKKEDDVSHFLEKLDTVRKGVIEGDEAFAGSPMARTYLSVSKPRGKVKVAANQELIDRKNEYSGFLVILSNHVKDAREALRIYRDKETAESAFDDMKNGSDFGRLRVRTESAVESKAFLVFLSLIIRLRMSDVMLADPSLRSKSREEVIKEMAILRKSVIGGSTLYSERTRLQKQVIKAFGIDVPFEDEVI
jgi:transposase